jgi:Flp pilus assembly protein TadG
VPGRAAHAIACPNTLLRFVNKSARSIIVVQRSIEEQKFRLTVPLSCVEPAMKISHTSARGRQKRCRGTAAVELATLLPLIVFISMASIDFARVVYALITLQNCARNGALYEMYSAGGFSLPSGWTSLSTAVNADAGGLALNTPTAATPSPPLATNNYVTVTVSTNFSPISYPALHGLPSIPGTITLTQSVSMAMPASTSAVP